ncbi:hypothetical protein TNCV_2666811 [Trichonephila clavipes]|nr:hypothetical protein TNCV_2666811 [Trichonephila clavipes]
MVSLNCTFWKRGSCICHEETPTSQQQQLLQQHSSGQWFAYTTALSSTRHKPSQASTIGFRSPFRIHKVVAYTHCLMNLYRKKSSMGSVLVTVWTIQSYHHTRRLVAGMCLEQGRSYSCINDMGPRSYRGSNMCNYSLTNRSLLHILKQGKRRSGSVCRRVGTMHSRDHSSENPLENQTASQRFSSCGVHPPKRS